MPKKPTKKSAPKIFAFKVLSGIHSDKNADGVNAAGVRIMDGVFERGDTVITKVRLDRLMPNRFRRFANVPDLPDPPPAPEPEEFEEDEDLGDVDLEFADEE